MKQTKTNTLPIGSLTKEKPYCYRESKQNKHHSNIPDSTVAMDAIHICKILVIFHFKLPH